MLQQLLLRYNELTGTLPAVWGENSSLPQLTTLELGGNALTGILPPWGSSGTSSSLVVLTVRSLKQGASLRGPRLGSSQVFAWCHVGRLCSAARHARSAPADMRPPADAGPGVEHAVRNSASHAVHAARPHHGGCHAGQLPAVREQAPRGALHAVPPGGRAVLRRECHPEQYLPAALPRQPPPPAGSLGPGDRPPGAHARQHLPLPACTCQQPCSGRAHQRRASLLCTYMRQPGQSVMLAAHVQAALLIQGLADPSNTTGADSALVGSLQQLLPDSNGGVAIVRALNTLPDPSSSAGAPDMRLTGGSAHAACQPQFLLPGVCMAAAVLMPPRMQGVACWLAPGAGICSKAILAMASWWLSRCAVLGMLAGAPVWLASCCAQGHAGTSCLVHAPR